MKKILILLVLSTFPSNLTASNSSLDSVYSDIVTIDFESSVEHKLLKLSEKLKKFRTLSSESFSVVSAEKRKLLGSFKTIRKQIEKSDPIENTYVRTQADYYNNLILDGMNSFASVWVTSENGILIEKVKVRLFYPQNPIDMLIRYESAPSEFYWQIIVVNMVQNGCSFDPDMGPVALSFEETKTLTALMENTPYFPEKDASIHMMIDGIRAKRERAQAMILDN